MASLACLVSALVLLVGSLFCFLLILSSTGPGPSAEDSEPLHLSSNGQQVGNNTSSKTLSSSSLFRDTVLPSSSPLALQFKENLAKSAEIRLRYANVRLPELLFAFYPTYPCQHLTMLGTGEDGSKWICGLTLLRAPCVVYSFGSAGNTLFEADMLRRSPCEVHIFDPTLEASTKDRVKSFARNSAHRCFFHDLGIRGQLKKGEDGKTYRRMHGEFKEFHEIISHLNHQKVDVLKMDIEGAELDVFLSMNASSSLIRVDQILLEVHVDELLEKGLKRLFEVLESSGFHLFHVYPNFMCMTCFEYSFVRV